ncbi:MAG: putative spermidine/putrescine transport system ATP-binding protein [Microbacteriaceae bacterium]|nr:putative spermidine/putrescine transport system ATP-binding protein [Microbacteriaceae bacterium]
MTATTATSTPSSLSAPNTGATVQLIDVVKDYAGQRALDGVALSINPGEFIALLGPSGCGKTTALRALSGLEQVDGGHILIDGKDVVDVPVNKRDIGMVFQSYSLFPHLTAGENVEFGLRMRKVGAAERRRRAAETLELVGLDHHVGRYAHQLSGGQQQRVALARALVTQPRVLLLDEPLSALDAKVRVQLREEIRRIQLDLGITTLYVTHDQEEALSVSDHVAVMYGGRIEQMGSPAEMYSAPATPFVAEYIGTMNRLEGTVVDGGVSHAGTTLRIEEAQSRPRGERVLVLVRPETVAVERANGGGGGVNTLVGDVVTQTFLGPVTRLKILGDGVDVIADVPTQKALSLPVGTRVAAVLPAEGARLLSLKEDVPQIAEEPVPAGR